MEKEEAMPFDSGLEPVSADKLVLQRARDRIAAGWCQGTLWDDVGNVCLVGALLGQVKRPALSEMTGLLGFGTPVDAIEWNNAPARTQAEVVARFDEAIARLG
jgi:hypothetical protein